MKERDRETHFCRYFYLIIKSLLVKPSLRGLFTLISPNTRAGDLPMSNKHKWWWEINRERATIEYEDDEGDPVVITPVFSAGTEDIPEDDTFSITVDDLEYVVEVTDDSIELASDEAITITVSKDVAYIFGFLAGLRTPVALPQQVWQHVQVLISACVGDYTKLEKLSDSDRKNLVTALSVLMHKTYPIPMDQQPRPKMEVLNGGSASSDDSEETSSESTSSEPDYSEILQQINSAYKDKESKES